MPLNDYTDPYIGLSFPRLQARIHQQKDGTCWVRLWLRKELGEEREVIMNRKIVGSWRDAFGYIFEQAAERKLTIEPDDVEVLASD